MTAIVSDSKQTTTTTFFFVSKKNPSKLRRLKTSRSQISHVGKTQKKKKNVRSTFCFTLVKFSGLTKMSGGIY